MKVASDDVKEKQDLATCNLDLQSYLSHSLRPRNDKKLRPRHRHGHHRRTQKDGKFKSIADFLERVKDRNLNKKSLEALIKSAPSTALATTAAFFSQISRTCSLTTRKTNGNRRSGFSLWPDGGHIVLADFQARRRALADSKEGLAWERELLGLYISGHPLEQFRAVIEKRDMNIEKAKTLADGKEIVVAGIIEELRPVVTKKGDPMMFLRLADFTGSIECVVFPRVLFEYRSSIAVDRCVAIKGKISERNGDKS